MFNYKLKLLKTTYNLYLNGLSLEEIQRNLEYIKKIKFSYEELNLILDELNSSLL